MREYLRPKRLLPWIGLSFLCLLLAHFWSTLDPSSKPDGRYATVSSILVYRLLALASAIFTTAIITQEVEQRTIVYLLTRPVKRSTLLLVRYAASVLVVTMLGVFGAVLTTLGAFNGLGGNSMLATDILAMSIGAMAYGALFLFVSLLFNRSLIICALFAFGWEASIPNMPGEMYRLSIFSYLQAIAQHPSQGDNKGLALLTGTAGDNAITRNSAFMTLGILVVVMLALSAWWFTKFEYVPREDSE
ncbi:ABC transporter permease [Fimbriimonas ginsengisoli]|nr:ABC transporter permease [Fimbriimonas ginsengisoli]